MGMNQTLVSFLVGMLRSTAVIEGRIGMDLKQHSLLGLVSLCIHSCTARDERTENNLGNKYIVWFCLDFH